MPTSSVTMMSTVDMVSHMVANSSHTSIPTSKMLQWAGISNRTLTPTDETTVGATSIFYLIQMKEHYLGKMKVG
jgi:hypothetical protein